MEQPYFGYSVAIQKHSAIFFNDYTGKFFSKEENEILLRFAKVFDQAYIRFLDLQKAEAQAREAQIQLALERVRARAMAMHKSDELLEAGELLYKQLARLGIVSLSSGYVLMDEEEKIGWNYGVNPADGKIMPVAVGIPHSETKVMHAITNSWRNQEPFFTIELNPEETKKHQTFIAERSINFPISASELIAISPESLVIQTFNFNQGYLLIVGGVKLNSEQLEIVVRFAKVFEMTYRRFLDLQKAEAQAKEAEIQLALERVRARTMAMQQSEELSETAAVVFKQLMNLGIEPNRIYIAIIKDETGNCEFWITDEDGSRVSSGFNANLNGNSAFKKMFEGWEGKKKSITIDMKGKELEEYFQHLNKLNVPFKGGLTQKRRIQYIAYFSRGFIGVASPDETKPETLQLLERFAYVFDLTYTRFNDLMQAEAQNKIIQAENERKTKELEEARELQLAMLPKKIPDFPGLDIKVYMETATEVGGDYYDFSLSHDGSINIAIGDATGHGMKAGTIVTMMKSLFMVNSAKSNIEEFFISSNAAIKNSNLKRMMAAFAMLNISDHKAKFINAGMPPLYHYKKSESKVEEIKHFNLPLGAMSIGNFKSMEIDLSSGDSLIMMSDGFPELHNQSDELFGYERVFSSIKKAVEKEPEEIISHFKNEAERWSNKKVPDDDVTFVVIKVK